MDKLGILRASREMRVGRHLMRTDPFPGKALGLGRLRRRGIRVVGRLSRVDGKRVGFAGESAEVDAVIWATGYRDDTDWVAIPEAKDEHGSRAPTSHALLPPLFFRCSKWSTGSAGGGSSSRRSFVSIS